MKKVLLTLLIMGMTSVGFADIQAPPRSQQTPVRKLGRSVSNLLYGISELPFYMIEMNKRDGNNAAFGAGVVIGTWRSAVRFGYGVWEFSTFWCAGYKKGFRAPYQNIEYDPFNGYDEFPPEIGFQSKYRYVRQQNY